MAPKHLIPSFIIKGDFCVQSDLDLLCSILNQKFFNKKFNSKQFRSWSDCRDVQADIVLHWSHVIEYMKDNLDLHWLRFYDVKG